jgi:hypothetical protein
MGGDSMPQWMQSLTAGWPMIWANLPLFGVILALIIGVVWLAFNWAYGRILANKDSEITIVKAQRDDYREKLGGASPDQAKARIDDLENKLNQLAKQVEQRSLTPDQRAIMAKVARIPQGTAEIVVLHEGGCIDCPAYSADLEQVLRDAGWKVITGVVQGPGRRPVLGLALLVSDSKNLDAQGTKLRDSLEAAKIQFNILEGRPSMGRYSLLLTAVRK